MKKTFLNMSADKPVHACAGQGFFADTVNGSVFHFRPTSFWVRR